MVVRNYRDNRKKRCRSGSRKQCKTLFKDHMVRFKIVSLYIYKDLTLPRLGGGGQRACGCILCCIFRKPLARLTWNFLTFPKYYIGSIWPKNFSSYCHLSWRHSIFFGFWSRIYQRSIVESLKSSGSRLKNWRGPQNKFFFKTHFLSIPLQLHKRWHHQKYSATLIFFFGFWSRIDQISIVESLKSNGWKLKNLRLWGGGGGGQLYSEQKAQSG